MRLSRPERAKVGHSLTAFLKPWICWAWGSFGASPLVWISVSTFLFPSFSRVAWPSAPERLRAFRWALKCSPCSCFPCSSRSSLSPPLAKATETRLSDMATASSSASPSFLDKAFSFLCSFIYFAFPTTSISPLPFRASPVAVPFWLHSSRPKRLDLLPPTRRIRHLTGLVSRGGYKRDYVSRDHSDHLTRLPLGLLRTSAGTELTSENSPSTHSGE